MTEPLSKQSAVLLHLHLAGTSSIPAAAVATRMTPNAARAMLLALERRGYAFERLGNDGDKSVERGRYSITQDGRREARWLLAYSEDTRSVLGEQQRR